MVKKTVSTHRKHVPTRTCVVCRLSLPKRELLRIVRTPEGNVVFDPTGKRSGRGAYVCRRRSCWDLAIRKKHLSHALKATLAHEELEALLATVGPLLAGAESESAQIEAENAPRQKSVAAAQIGNDT